MKRTMTILLACAVMAMTAEGASSIDLGTNTTPSGVYDTDQSFTLGNKKEANLTRMVVRAKDGAILSFVLGDASTLNLNTALATINVYTGSTGKASITLGTSSRITVKKEKATAKFNLTGFSTENGLILNFGEESAISADTVDLSSSKLSITTTVSTSGDFYTGLIQNGTASWDLITTTAGLTTDTSTTFALSEISELKNLGLTLNTDLLTSTEQLGKNSYGLVLADNKLQLVARTPEPATATLSLLALAGLAARRRRH